MLADRAELVADMRPPTDDECRHARLGATGRSGEVPSVPRGDQSSPPRPPMTDDASSFDLERVEKLSNGTAFSTSWSAASAPRARGRTDQPKTSTSCLAPAGEPRPSRCSTAELGARLRVGGMSDDEGRRQLPVVIDGATLAASRLPRGLPIRVDRRPARPSHDHCVAQLWTALLSTATTTDVEGIVLHVARSRRSSRASGTPIARRTERHCPNSRRTQHAQHDPSGRRQGRLGLATNTLEPRRLEGASNDIEAGCCLHARSQRQRQSSVCWDALPASWRWRSS